MADEREREEERKDRKMREENREEFQLLTRFFMDQQDTAIHFLHSQRQGRLRNSRS